MRGLSVDVGLISAVLAHLVHRRQLRLLIAAAGLAVCAACSLVSQEDWTPVTSLSVVLWFAVGALVGSTCVWFVRALGTANHRPLDPRRKG